MFFKKSKIKKILIISLFVFLGTFFLETDNVWGGADDDNWSTSDPVASSISLGVNNGKEDGAGGVAGLFLGAIATLMYGIFYFTSLFLGLAIWLLGVMTSHEVYEKVLFSPTAIYAVNIGWQLVRDFLNLFFILILIFIAISTTLGVGRFSDKRVVFRVILAALLVNFSKPIALFIFDISNLAMNFFINNIASAKINMAEVLAHKSKISNLFTMDMNNQTAYIVGISFAIIFIFILALILFILAASLVFRMIAIWVLIILSPIAFFGLALPGTVISGATQNWLRKVTNWAFFGPLLLFFLWLSLVIIGVINEAVVINGSTLNFEITGGTNEGVEGTAQNIISTILGIIIPYLVSIYFLFYGYDLSRQMSQNAGKSVGNLMAKGEAFTKQWARKAAFATGVAATGGVGYYAGKAAAERAADYASVKKQKWSEGEGAFGFIGKRVSKKARDEAREKRKAKWSGVEDSYYRPKAIEQLRKYETEGVDEEKIMETIQGSDPIKARAMALYAAKYGKLDNITKYETALRSLGNDKALVSKFIGDVKRRNMYVLIQSDVERARQENPNLTQDQIQQIYEERLKGLKFSDFNSQDSNLHRDPNFREFVQRHWKNPSVLRDQAVRNLNGEKLSIWEEEGYFNQTSQRDFFDKNSSNESRQGQTDKQDFYRENPEKDQEKKHNSSNKDQSSENQKQTSDTSDKSSSEENPNKS